MRKSKSGEPKSTTRTRVDLLAEFDGAPDWALFNQKSVAAIRNCSEALLERDRWAGGGIPFVRDGRSVRYRKADVVTFLNRHKTAISTAHADALAIEG